ncbi:MAG: DNA mismatch repair endonuclease MutL [Planctomycetota bacterium]|jgi:DNA mismatch repair protein MutL
MPIRPLPPLLVNQIAAGEVVERPASVVKELVENAIDAGATRVDVAIEAGGRDLVRVADDGRGIETDELPLAVAPHATSKLETAGDLDAIATLGFRGEALASIASVSRMTVRSRPAGSEEAGEIAVEGDRVDGPKPAAGPPGTTVAVRNLFFNTPARRRFLRSDRAETGRVTETLRALALAHPGVAFTLAVDGRTTLDLPVHETPRERALALVGPELADELLEVDADRPGVRIWGLVGRPAIARPTSSHLRVFVNGRPVSDRAITHAIREAYRGLVDPHRHPTALLFLVLDPASVDVNVHPAKAEVRFREPSLVHGAVLASVRDRLRAAELVPALDLGPATPAVAAGPVPEFGAGPGATPAPAAIVETFRRLDRHQKGFVYGELQAALAREAPDLVDAPGAAAEVETLPAVRPVTDVLQVHASYLVAPDEQGLLIIDQHALHERVMFETLRERMEAGPLESQRMLMPAVVETDESRVGALEALRPLLTRLGIEAEAMGPRAVAVHAFTSLLFERGVNPVDFMEDVLGRGDELARADDTEAALHEVLDMMACKAAVKAGDRLTERELRELLEARERVERSSRCPHGRPTTLRLTLEDLERQFGRR